MSKQNKIHQFDRGIIAIFGLLSILSDGWLSDGLVMISMLLWLWLPEWEEKLLSIYFKERNQAKKMH
ncbi:MAG: hypothetical protein GY951_03980 [Psychromonas sp.]|nr:hypothetical protein [Alteromonadales bacterium]MCP5077199.1 hypothetical protein [Psychromonas sp.]